jgi:hypothetical protein
VRRVERRNTHDREGFLAVYDEAMVYVGTATGNDRAGSLSWDPGGL